MLPLKSLVHLTFYWGILRFRPLKKIINIKRIVRRYYIQVNDCFKYKKDKIINFKTLPVTVTMKKQVEIEFPEPSVAVYVTVVIPIGKSVPEFLLPDNETEPELSEAVGSVQLTVAVATPLSVLVAM